MAVTSKTQQTKVHVETADQHRAAPGSAQNPALRVARDVYTHKSTAPKTLGDVVKTNANSADGSLISHADAHNFLNNFLARSGKVRSKP